MTCTIRFGFAGALLALVCFMLVPRTAQPADQKKASTPPPVLSPRASHETLQTPDDLVVDLVLAEPEIRQPIFINFDARGRLWVMNYIQYPYPAGLKMISRDQYWRAVYDKIPLPPPKGTKGADKITIHEDTDGDGIYDKHKTFVDGLNIATSFAFGHGGVWVLNPPYLLFYPDRNRDDVPDGDPEVHLQGFGLEDTHSVVNSLRFGPDGWLYAAQGSTVSGRVRRPDQDEKDERHSMGQQIWRYHPETRRYETFAEGGGNAFGVEIDSKGRIFSGHNGGNTRGFAYVQGGYFQKGFSKHGPLSNPFAFGYFPAMKHEKVPRFTHNFIIYEGTGLPERYRGRLFGVEPLQRRVVMSRITPDGSSFQTTDVGYAMISGDPRVRPVEIKAGPDGGIYFADMYEHLIAHRDHFAGNIDKTDGRIYRIRGKNWKPLPHFNYYDWPTRKLVDLLRHPDKWHRQTAQQLIADRQDRAQLIPTLQKLLKEEKGQLALEALWALNRCGGLDRKTALKCLEHADPYVRQWTVRLMCDRVEIDKEFASKLPALAAKEPHIHVRSQLASSAQRLDAAFAVPLVRALLDRSEDADDIHLPLLLWWAIEKKAESNRDAVIALFRDPKLWNLPIVKRHILERIMRRYAQAGTRKDLKTCAELLNLAPTREHASLLMNGFETAFKGRSLAELPDELIKAIATTGAVSLVLQLRRGDAEAIQKALALIADDKADIQKRFDYIQVFGEINQPACVPILLDIVVKSRDDRLRMAALSSLQPYPDAMIGKRVVEIYGQLSDDVRAVAHSLLASRAVWARQFLEAVSQGKIDRLSVPTDVVRRMTLHRDPRIADIIKKTWGNIEGATSEQMQKDIVKYRALLAQTRQANRSNGRKLFLKNCGKCHKLFNEGGQIGPDLTPFQRNDLDNLLANIVNPSAEIREGFETYVVITVDGRVIEGFLVDRDNQVVVLRGADGQNVTIPQKSIDEMSKKNKSLMPEQLLKDYSPQEIRDLFSYLQSSQPLNEK
ncbi:MAG: L-sorbosone dehydrogenase [Gemmatales bacterium]|nr:MAG: L-sorbosone dehydrogenase [Gemmatales bacterium]